MPTVQLKQRGRPRDPDSKRSQGLDRHRQPRKVFHGPPELFAALARYCRSQRFPTDEATVMRAALWEFLERAGYRP